MGTSPVLGTQLFHTHALIRANTMATRTTKFQAAAAHAAPVFMNKAATIRKTVALIEQAGAEDVKLLVFPETFIPGYPYWAECYAPLKQVNALAKYAEESVVVEPNGEDIGAIQDACRRTGVAINLGISERVANGHTL